MEELLVLVENPSCVALPNNIGANAQEMLTIFREELPFNFLDTIDGQCISWDENFINKISIAMTTGSLADFSNIEKQVWYSFVEFQDAMTHSAPTTYLGAIGCTAPDLNGNSFVVTESGITLTKCENPATTVQKERQSKSLDDYLMDLYNCEEPNTCGIITGDITDIAPCPII